MARVRHARARRGLSTGIREIPLARPLLDGSAGGQAVARPLSTLRALGCQIAAAPVEHGADVEVAW